jgi:protein TonB
MTGPYASTEPDRRNRVVSLAASIVIHLVLMIILSFFLVIKPRQPELIELDWGSTSGAPNQNITQTETDPNRHQESAPAAAAKTESKLDLPVMKNPAKETVPAPKKISKATSTGTSKTRTQGATAAKTTPRRRRSTEGPAGGSGKSTGYSIDWAGSGTRRLLSGRLPQYPPGTNKDLPVLLQFTVSGIIPVVKSDELLEREAISALRTWRFDPLPPQFEQKPQMAKITFIFKLE